MSSAMAAMADSDASASRLKESIVRGALSALCWKKLNDDLAGGQLPNDTRHL
jgi:hypothetical protein